MQHFLQNFHNLFIDFNRDVRYASCMSVARYDNAFGKWLKGVLEEHNISSSRQAKIRTGIAHTTIESLIHGTQPNVNTVVRIAEAFHADIGECLRLAGHEDVASAWQNREVSNTQNDAPASIEPASELVGLYFHSFNSNGDLEHEGVIDSYLGDDSYFVNIADWDGRISNSQIVTLQEMKGWKFYTSRESAIEDANKLLKSMYERRDLEQGRGEPETRLEGSSGGSGEYHSDDIPPELQQVWSFQGKVYNELPPGKARDLYLESLRANAQSMRELVSVRLKAEAVAEVRAPYTTEEK